MVTVAHMVALFLVIVDVVVDLHVAVPVPFLHLVVIVVVIDSYELLVVIVVPYVRRVHCIDDHLTVLSVVGIGGICPVVWVLRVVLLVLVLDIVYLHLLTYVRCPARCMLLELQTFQIPIVVVQRVVLFVPLAAVLRSHRRSN